MFRLHCRLSPVSVTVSVQSPSPSEFRVRRGLSRVFVAVRVPSSSRSLSARPRSLSQFRRGLSPVLPRCTVCRRPCYCVSRGFRHVLSGRLWRRLPCHLWRRSRCGVCLRLRHVLCRSLSIFLVFFTSSMFIAATYSRSLSVASCSLLATFSEAKWLVDVFALIYRSLIDIYLSTLGDMPALNPFSIVIAG